MPRLPSLTTPHEAPDRESSTDDAPSQSQSKPNMRYLIFAGRAENASLSSGGRSGSTLDLWPKGRVRYSVEVTLYNRPEQLRLSGLPLHTRADWRFSHLIVYDEAFENSEIYTLAPGVNVYSDVLEICYDEDAADAEDDMTGEYYSAVFVPTGHRDTTKLSQNGLTTDNDVVFIFPFEEAGSPTHLWANASRLAGASTYFKDMLESGIEETANVLGNTQDLLNSYEKAFADIVERERAQTGDALISRAHHTEGRPATDSSSKCQKSESSPLRYVVIRATPYKCYKAVLDWLETGGIEFASVAGESASMHCSGKTIYQISHEMELHELSSLALLEYRAQLSARNVIEEALSGPAFAYESLRRAALDYIVENWSEVKQSGAKERLLAIVEEQEGSSKEIALAAIELLVRL